MKYVGSKARMARYLVPFILGSRRRGALYVEPFVGGCNMMDKVSGPRLAADANGSLIAMWKALQAGWQPPLFVSRVQYEAIRDDPARFSPHLVGWVSTTCSYSGKVWGGYAGVTATREGRRDYHGETIGNVLRQLRQLEDVEFVHSPYDRLDIPDGSVVYCDPPYRDTLDYRDTVFDSDAFWSWARDLSRRCRVWISEYGAPDDFACVWSQSVKSSLSANGKIGGSKLSVERLFTILPR